MGQPYVGQLLLVPYSFAPAGWMFCQGQLLPISENDTLFALLGTTFGGDGQTTFGLPDLRGRTPIHTGNNGQSNYTLGQTGGVEQVTVTLNQIPVHTHVVTASSSPQSNVNPGSNVLATGPTIYIPNDAPNNTMAANSLGNDGGSQPHENLQPYLTMNWIISLFGIFPQQA